MLAHYSRAELASIIAWNAAIEAMKRRHVRNLRASNEREAQIDRIERSQKRVDARAGSAVGQRSATDALVTNALLDILKQWNRRRPCNDKELRDALIVHFAKSRGVRPSNSTIYRSFIRVTAD
jgi:hypothetical protein